VVRCLDSLRNQTLRDIQIICIDDASTDNTLALLRQQAEEDNRITVLHLTENRGQAYARNQGLKVVDAEFVTMVDIDDTLSLDALASAYDVFERYPKTDAVVFRLVYRYPDGREIPYPFLTVRHPDGSDPSCGYFTGEEAFVESLDQTLHGLYVVRSDIHREIPYDETCRLYSDDNTAHMHYLRSREVRYCNGIYYYLQREDSMTHGVNIHRFDFLDAGYSLKEQVLRSDPSPDALLRTEQFRWNAFLSTMRFYHEHADEFPRKQRPELLERLRDCWDTLDRRQLKRTLSGRWIDKPNGGFRFFHRLQSIYVGASRVYHAGKKQ
jgi:glycosyltransferase involved in cell wall biosynthesis